MFLGVLFAMHLVGTGLFLLKVEHGSALDYGLAVVQALARGAVFVGVFGLLLDASRRLAVRRFFGGLAFFLVASESIDFLLFHNAGQHLTYLVRVLWSGGLGDFKDLVVATRVTTVDLVWSFGLVPVLFLVGAGVVGLTARASARFDVRYARLAWVVGLGVAVGLGEQAASRRWKNHRFYVSERETFAYYLPVIPPGSDVRYRIALDLSHDEALDEREVERAKTLPRPPASRHVFYVVLESVRASYITPEIAPNLSRFRERHGGFRSAHSSANATVNSWFSMFHGRHAIHWHPYLARASFPGSTALRIAKSLGLELTLVTSSDLAYHQYDRTLFGDGFSLVDHRIDTSKTTLTRPAEGDREAMRAFRAALPAMKASGKPQLSVLFLESGHHDYYWPGDEPAPFRPYIDKFDYTRVRYSATDLELVKNRYKNSIHFLDGLVGELLHDLEELGMYDDSIVVFVGDHGEEFMEKGRLVHSSNLYEPQTTPVFLVKVPGAPDGLRAERVSHVQIMPTILASLGYDAPKGLFDGLPIGAPGSGDLQLVAKARIPDIPSKYVIHTGDKKLFFELDEFSTSRSRSAYATEITSEDDVDETPEGSDRRAVFDAAFVPALEKLPFLRLVEAHAPAR